MKKGISIMLAVLIFLSACSNSDASDHEKARNDREKDTLISALSTITDSDGETVAEFFYDEDGMICQIHYNPDYSDEYMFTIEANPDDRTFNIIDSADDRWWTSYICNEAGQPETGYVHVRAANDAVLVTLEYLYDDSGLLQSITARTSPLMGWDGYWVGFDYEYDAEGNLIQRNWRECDDDGDYYFCDVYHSEGGKILSGHSFDPDPYPNYNRNGKPISEEEYFAWTTEHYNYQDVPASKTFDTQSMRFVVDAFSLWCDL